MANSAAAETSELPNALVGSDTLNQVMDNLLPALPLSGTGITSYAGLGSSAGERQLEGSPNTASGEPDCTDPTGPGGENMGCQEIAPMSRHMDSSICDDSEAAGNAEGLAICRDGIVLVTDNASLGQYGESQTACSDFAALADTDNSGPPTPNFVDNGVGNLRTSGTLPNTGYVIGANLPAGDEWQDVVRLVFTGCQNDDGDCTTTVSRFERCSDPVRQELLAQWSNLVQDSTECQSGLCADGLKHAFRRDDNSGTTGVFLELIGVDDNDFPARTSITSGVFSPCNPSAPVSEQIFISSIPNDFPFCDGGMMENFFPDCQNEEFIPVGGDPIRKDCRPGDDLCAFDGKHGVVQAMRSTPSDTTYNPYPEFQCTRGAFATQAYVNSSAPVCPDGTVPLGGECNMPFYDDNGTQNFDCVNTSNSRPSTVPSSTDGRAYNFVATDAAGTVDKLTANLPGVSSWRMDMAQLDTGLLAFAGFQFAPADYVCTEDDATRNIGCLTANSTCNIGFAGREAAYSALNDHHLGNEPFQVQGSLATDDDIGGFTYPLARELYVNAIGGFENLSADCAARGESSDFCNDQIIIAQEFYETGMAGNLVAGICQDAGYIPLPAASCVGATASAGCGAATSQALSACEPL